MPEIVWSHIKNFKRSEFDYPDEMSPQLMRQLDVARDLAGVPFIITSDYRPGDKKAHGKGLAVDLRVMSSRDRFHILKGLFRACFVRIGDYDRHIHADIDDSLPQKVAWWGTSH